MGVKKNKIKINVTEDKKGEVKMEINFHFPARKVNIKAVNLDEAIKKVNKKI
jgi:hypothetical protein